MRIGKYELGRELGQGSMGVVHEAFDSVIDRTVAIKIIRRDHFGAGGASDLLARLRREAQAAGRLNHPNVVALYDFGEDIAPDGKTTAFIVMEMVRGRELKADLDRNRRFSSADAVGVMTQVLSALQHAHDRGVTHRDIKPSNVLLQEDGVVKVTDFGIARIDTSDLTQTGTVIGTPAYMSPEQLLGLTVDGRSDLFSCGVMLYQMLAAEQPFVGSAATVMHKVLHQEPVPISVLNPTLGSAWDVVLKRALAKKVDSRYRTAGDMIVGMRDALSAQDAEATVLSPSDGSGRNANRSSSQPAMQRTVRASAIRWTSRFAAVSLLALIAWSYFTFFVSRAPDPKKRTDIVAGEAPAPAVVDVAMRESLESSAPSHRAILIDPDPSTASPRAFAPLVLSPVPPMPQSPQADNADDRHRTRVGSTAQAVGPAATSVEKHVIVMQSAAPKGSRNASTAETKRPTQSAKPSTNVPVQGSWIGILNCSILLTDKIKSTHKDGFRAKVGLELSGHTILWTRSDGTFVEKLIGSVDDSGHWTAVGEVHLPNSNNGWLTRAGGDYQAGDVPGMDGVVTITTLDGSAPIRNCTFTAAPGASNSLLSSSIEASARLNPSTSDRPSPVAIRLYELRSAAAFNDADFVSLYRSDRSKLGPDLISREDMLVEPGATIRFERRLNTATRFLGVFVAFRDIEHAEWRKTIAVVAEKPGRLTIKLDERTVTSKIAP